MVSSRIYFWVSTNKYTAVFSFNQAFTQVGFANLADQIADASTSPLTYDLMDHASRGISCHRFWTTCGVGHLSDPAAAPAWRCGSFDPVLLPKKTARKNARKGDLRRTGLHENISVKLIVRSTCPFFARRRAALSRVP